MPWIPIRWLSSSDPHHGIWKWKQTSDIWHIFWHSICSFIWHLFGHSIWHKFWQSGIPSDICWHSVWHIQTLHLPHILTFNLNLCLELYLPFCHCIWHSFYLGFGSGRDHHLVEKLMDYTTEWIKKRPRLHPNATSWWKLMLNCWGKRRRYRPNSKHRNCLGFLVMITHLQWDFGSHWRGTENRLKTRATSFFRWSSQPAVFCGKLDFVGECSPIHMA